MLMIVLDNITKLALVSDILIVLRMDQRLSCLAVLLLICCLSGCTRGDNFFHKPSQIQNKEYVHLISSFIIQFSLHCNLQIP